MITSNLTPTCPLILLSGSPSPLLVQGMSFIVDVNVSVALVTIHGQCYNHTGRQGLGVFCVPMNSDATVTEARVIINDERIIETQVIPIEEAQKYVKQNTKSDEFSEFSKYNPKLFRLPLTNLQPADTLKFSISYLEPLFFKSTTGNYEFQLPMTLPPSLFPPQIIGSEPVLDVFVNINAGTTNVKWGCSSHIMEVRQSGAHYVQLALNKAQGGGWNRQNKTFSISYSAWSPDILSTLFVQPPVATDVDQRGSFLLFIAPPGPIDPSTIQIPRSVVFLLDRSGSMSGDPMIKAIEAVRLSLINLKPFDTFTIVAFDDQMEYFSPSLLPANPEILARAQQWLNSISARGGTDIMNPVMWSMNLLETASGMPFTFLITDGAVSGEQDICIAVKKRNSRVRISTFGIGTYCNGYFLKMLASIGRGFSDVALDSEGLVDKMARLFTSLNAPVLTDIEIGIPNVSNVEIYPFPIQDLFLGAPVVVSGKYSGNFPSQMSIRGVQTGNRPFQINVPPFLNSNIPVSKVFVRQQLELLTAQAWLTGDKKYEKQAIDLSINQSMPSAYTTMVAYETTPQKKQQEAKKKNNSSSSSSTATKAAVGALAVGGVILVGATVLSFGDIGATLSNLNVGDAFSAIGNGLGDVGHLLGDGFSGVGHIASEAAGGISHIANEAAGGISHIASEAAGGISHIASEAAGGISHVAHEAGGLCGGCGGCDGCDGIGHVIGDVAGGIFHVAGDCFGALGGCCGDVIGFLPHILGGLCEALGSCDL